MEFTEGDSAAYSTGSLCSLHSYHLYVIRIDSNVLNIDRTTLFTKLHENGIGVNVHYIPVDLHPYYRKYLEIGPGLCPVAESAYEENISLPMFPGMIDKDFDHVVACLIKATNKSNY